MPGFSSEDFRISTLPAFGRCMSAAPANEANNAMETAKRNFIARTHLSWRLEMCFVRRPYIMNIS